MLWCPFWVVAFQSSNRLFQFFPRNNLHQPGASPKIAGGCRIPGLHAPKPYAPVRRSTTGSSASPPTLKWEESSAGAARGCCAAATEVLSFSNSYIFCSGKISYINKWKIKEVSLANGCGIMSLPIQWVGNNRQLICWYLSRLQMNCRFVTCFHYRWNWFCKISDEMKWHWSK